MSMKKYCVIEKYPDLSGFKRQQPEMNELNSIQFTDSIEKDTVIVSMNFPDRKGTKMFGIRIDKDELKQMMAYLDN